MTKSKIKDVYVGESMQVWTDGELFYIDIFPNGLTFCMTKGPWNDFVKDLKKFVKEKTKKMDYVG